MGARKGNGVKVAQGTANSKATQVKGTAKKRKQAPWKTFVAGFLALFVYIFFLSDDVLEWLSSHQNIGAKTIQVPEGSLFTTHGSYVFSPVFIGVGETAESSWRGLESVKAASQALDKLDVIEATAWGGTYNRDDWRIGGREWQFDFDNSGCNTRDDLLRAYLSNVTMRDRCTVESGTYVYEPYIGKENVQWSKAEANRLQGEHIVALENASRSGAESWGTKDRILPGVPLDKAERKLAFANDPLNLILADGKANASKGSKSADQWLPSNSAFHCEYVTRQILVKYKYDLAVTGSEKVVMSSIVDDCLKVE